MRRWIETPAAAREAMSKQAIATFNQRYDMRKNAVTIIRLFEDIVPPERRVEQKAH